jgi:hypothetical protein
MMVLRVNENQLMVVIALLLVAGLQFDSSVIFFIYYRIEVRPTEVDIFLFKELRLLSFHD